LRDLDEDGRITLKWILKKQDTRVSAEIIWLRHGPMAGSFEQGNELPFSIKGGGFIDQLSVLSASQKELWSMELVRVLSIHAD
jgi:hypothetical protein